MEGITLDESKGERIVMDKDSGNPALYFKLMKDNGEDLSARYNSYLHMCLSSPLNDQFASAWDRENLVVLRVKVPMSELNANDPYRGLFCKDSVGRVAWREGVVSSALSKAGKPREVALSRYDMPVEEVPVEEVADMIAKQLDGTGIEIPINTVTPQLQAALRERGVRFCQAEKKGRGANAMLQPGDTGYEEFGPDKASDALRFSRDETGRHTKRTVEKGFGGLWIEDRQEFAKFASATVNNRFEQDGEGLCYTDNHFYAYYRNIDGEAVPFIEINLNAEDSQELVEYVQQERAKGADTVTAIDSGISNIRSSRLSSHNNRSGADEATSERDMRLVPVDSGAIRRGRYADLPKNYVKAVEPLRPGDHRDNVDSATEPATEATPDDHTERVNAAKAIADRLGTEVTFITDPRQLAEEARRHGADPTEIAHGAAPPRASV